jgi:NAD-dependent deacetylase
MTSIAILTGAGISTGAGIPDFRGKQGLWTLHPEMKDIFDYAEYMSKPKVRMNAWAWMRNDAGMNANAPTKAHLSITDLQRTGRLLTLATQNIDNLHELAGSSDVSHLHGETTASICQRCGAIYDTKSIMDNLVEEPDPHCHWFNRKKNKECGGVIKMNVVYFGESLDRRMFHDVEHGLLHADEFWAIGTSLTVYPVADLVKEALSMHKRLIIINNSETPFDDHADGIIRGDIQSTLPRFINAYL